MSSYANLLRLGAYEIREYKDKPEVSTLDMRGRPKAAQPTFDCPLDGKVWVSN